MATRNRDSGRASAAPSNGDNRHYVSKKFKMMELMRANIYTGCIRPPVPAKYLENQER